MNADEKFIVTTAIDQSIALIGTECFGEMSDSVIDMLAKAKKILNPKPTKKKVKSK